MDSLRTTLPTGGGFGVRKPTPTHIGKTTLFPNVKPVDKRPEESVQLSAGVQAVKPLDTISEVAVPKTESKPEPYKAPEGITTPIFEFAETPSSEISQGSCFVLKSVLDSLPKQGFESAPALLKSLGVMPGQKTGKDFDTGLTGREAADQLVDWSAGQVHDLLDKGKHEWASEVLQGKHNKLAGKSVFDALGEGADRIDGENSPAYQRALKAGTVPGKEVVFCDDIHFVDTYTTELARERGYSGLPTLVEPGTLEGMKASGEVSELVYRGQPKSFNEDLLINPELKFRVSSGRTTFGPGIYVSQNEGDASVYINSCRRGEASLFKMGLKKGARVETTSTLDKMMEADRSALRKQSEKRVQALEAELSGSDPESTRRIQKQIEDEQKSLGLKEELLFGVQEPLSRDYSRYAINKGYDAVVCQGEHATLNVLNRSALVIERPSSGES